MNSIYNTKIYKKKTTEHGSSLSSSIESLTSIDRVTWDRARHRPCYEGAVIKFSDLWKRAILEIGSCRKKIPLPGGESQVASDNHNLTQIHVRYRWLVS